MTDFNHFACDSRKVREGSLFFAIRGEKTDGHNFLEQAQSLGAHAAVVDEGFCGESFGLKLIYKKSVQSTLAELARKKLLETKACIVAITGSVGKTSTKEFLVQLLEGLDFNATKDNENTNISLPLMILNQPKKGLYVLEMGMSHPYDIEAKCSIAPPDIAVVTQVSLSHSQYFKSLSSIVEEKTKILRGVKKAFVHVRNRPFIKQDVTYFADAKSSLLNQIRQKAPHIPTFLHENLHAAVLVALELGVARDKIFKKLELIQSVSKRFQIIKHASITFINDAYNASSLSFTTGIQEVLTFKNKRKIAVVAKMGELGSFERGEHEIVAKKLSPFDHVLCLGQDFYGLENALYFSNRKSLLEALYDLAEKNDLVYIKGSNSSGLYKLVDEFIKR